MKYASQGEARRFSQRSRFGRARSQAQVQVFSGLALCLTLLLWGLSLPAIDPSGLDHLGLVALFPLAFYAALFVLAVSFSVALATPKVPQWLLLIHPVVFIWIAHATPILVYDTLRYSWAWKHLGIVDYILRHGTVDRTVESMNVYHNWPGFFAAAALFTKAAGFSSPLPFASWSPVFFNLLNLGALMLLLPVFVKHKEHLWLALWIVAITSWIGQDYFAPQALALFFHLVALGIVARWFARTGSARPELKPPKVLTLLLLLLGLFIAIATSHQLTPFVTMLSLAVLTLLSRDRFSSLPVVMGIITVTWVVYGATPFFQAEFKELVQTFGRLSDHLGDTLVPFSSLTPAQRLVALSGRALTLTVWGLALVGMSKHVLVHRARSDWRLIALTGASFLLLGANSYGGEVQFRIYLFSLPFMALWVADLFRVRIHRTSFWWSFTATLALSGVLISLFVIAYYGNEDQYYFSPEEITASRVLYRVAPEGSLIVEGSPNYPSRYVNYDFYNHVAISREPTASRERIVEKPVRTMERWMSNPTYTDAFIIFTRGQKRGVDPIGALSSTALDRMEAALRASPKFRVIYQNSEAVIFILKDRPREVQP